jgi:endonuclease/exonuclease/phosphatase (EEP) superfamily protein YafD
MDTHRYRRLNVALSLSLFVGCLTSRCSGTLVSGLAAFVGFLIFSSLVLFIVGSSSTIYEAIATSLKRRTGVLFAPVLYRRVVRRVAAVCLATTTLVLPFRFQLPPPTLSL